MTKLELLEERAAQAHVQLIACPMPQSLCAAYVRSREKCVIGVAQGLPRPEATAAVGEQLGHHFAQGTNLLEAPTEEAGRQRRAAAKWAYRQLLPLDELGEAYLLFDANPFSMAEHLDVPVRFLDNAVAAYRERYGVCACTGRYTFRFIPYFEVGRLG